jgi:hypothetical protein
MYTNSLHFRGKRSVALLLTADRVSGTIKSKTNWTKPLCHAGQSKPNKSSENSSNSSDLGQEAVAQRLITVKR